MLLLLVLLGADATHWQNTAVSLERGVRPEAAREFKKSYGEESSGYPSQPNEALPWLTLGVGLFQAWLAYQIWIVYRAQAKIMSGQLEAARDAASAAKIQAETAAQTISHLERPHIYLIIEHNFQESTRRIINRMYSATWPYRVELVPTVSFKLKNYGKTPAILTQIRAHVIEDGDVPAIEGSFSLMGLGAQFVIADGETSHVLQAGLGGEYRLNEDDLNRLQNGDSFWWFYGAVRYDDILGWEHIHHFCWRWDFGEAESALFEYPGRNYTEYREHPGRYRSARPY
jgi:hypothetical protein